MPKYLVSLIARWSLAMLTAALVVLVSEPIWARPEIAVLVVDGLKVLLITAPVCGAALMVGLVIDHLRTLQLRRPPTAADLAAGLPIQFATSVDAVRIAHEEALAPVTSGGGWPATVSKFAFIGNVRGFGWRAMCPYIGREDWKAMTALLVNAEPEAILSPARGNQAPQWVNGWSYCKLRPALKYRRQLLPYPAGAPPVVTWGRASHKITHATHAEHAVIDMTVAEAARNIRANQRRNDATDNP
jgi:hypothetical protein